MRVDRRVVGVAADGLVAVLLAAFLVAAAALPERGTAAWRPPGESAQPCGGWDCALQARFATTGAFVQQTAGYLAIAVKDRTTGQIWQSGAADRPIWTTSMIKLAIIADLLVRARAGELTITPSMRKGFDDMLATSLNRPATNLWVDHGGEEALQRYRSVFGMTGVHFPTSERLWGALKATALDFIALMSYVLDTMHPEDRDYIIEAMRTVEEIQQWGVWAAGPDRVPGVKAGWNVEQTPEGENHWVLNSVGFAGPDARYVLVVMYELLPGTQSAGNRLGDGLHAVSDAVATLFGAPVPAAVPSPNLLLGEA